MAEMLGQFGEAMLDLFEESNRIHAPEQDIREVLRRSVLKVKYGVTLMADAEERLSMGVKEATK
jgi:hypothetical protein